MSAGVKMYGIKPIINSAADIYVSKCMYEMKNIHGRTESINHVQCNPTGLDISAQHQNSKQMLPEMSALEERQRKILDQLEQLKNQMQTIRTELKLCAKPIQLNPQSHTSCSPGKAINLKNLQSIALKVNSACIPYGLLLLQKCWANSLQLAFHVHTHSSIKQLPTNVINFCERLRSPYSKNGLPVLEVTLIWKDVSHNMELVVSSLKAPIQGEVNVLRYLARIGPGAYNYENYDVHSALMVDSILDICYRLVRATTKSERQALTRALNAKLGKATWMVGSETSIADVAVYGAFLQCGLTNDLTIAMTNWLQRCEQL